jgi:hypothetical protein
MKSLFAFIPAAFRVVRKSSADLKCIRGNRGSAQSEAGGQEARRALRAFYTP